MSFSHARIMSLIVNTPLLAHPRMAMTFYNALCGRFGTAPGEMPETQDASLFDSRVFHEGRPGIDASRFEGDFVRSEDDSWRGVEPFRRTKDGIALITVTGELVNRGAFVGSSSGLTSYEGVSFQLERAAKDRRSEAIILDVESPGGQAIGAMELGALVKKISAEKPVYSVVNGVAASAAYAMVSGSTHITNTPSGIAGSIGVVMLHLDHSKALAEKGVVPTLIHAGAHKVDGNPYEPLPEAVREDLQAECNQIYDSFLETVAAGRGRRMSKKAARDTQARTYIGQSAVDVGLADAVGTFNDVLAEVTAKLRKARKGGTTNSTRSKAMPGSRLGIDSDEQNTNQPQTSTSTAALSQGDVDAAFERGKAQGSADFAAKLSTILGNEKCKGREQHALRIATKSPNMSADDVIACIEDIPVASAAAPQPGPSATEQLQQRAAATGVNDIQGNTGTPGHGTTGNPGSANDGLGADAGWDAHLKVVNERRAGLTAKR